MKFDARHLWFFLIFCFQSFTLYGTAIRVIDLQYIIDNNTAILNLISVCYSNLDQYEKSIEFISSALSYYPHLNFKKNLNVLEISSSNHDLIESSHDLKILENLLK